MTAPDAPILVGWAECVDLDRLGLRGVHAKIDTGARTSALHATDIQCYDKATSRGVQRRVRFRSEIGPDAPHLWCDARVHDERPVTSSNGAEERRIIIRTPMILGGRRRVIQLSLTDRTPMAFPMLIGRSALRRHFRVDVATKYLHGAPH